MACSKPEPPRITPRSVRVAAISPAGLGLALELDVYNPNSFPILAQRVSGTVEIGNGVELGRGGAQPQGAIPAKGSTVIASQLGITWTNAAALAPYALSPGPVPYTLRGTAAIGSERLNVDVPFTVKGELTREQVLQAGLSAGSGRWDCRCRDGLVKPGEAARVNPGLWRRSRRDAARKLQVSGN
jgi:LEA14-like dessication related protein